MTTISFKVSEEEARLIRSWARKEGLGVSEYLRRRARGPMHGVQKPRRLRCPHTGAMIFSARDDQSPLTTDTVRELLSDFP